MTKIIQNHPRLMAFGLWLSVLALLTLSAVLPALRFHHEQSARVIQNRAQALAPVVQALLVNAEQELALSADDLSDPRPLNALLRTERMDGLIEMRLSDDQGYPVGSIDTPQFLEDGELAELRQRKPRGNLLRDGVSLRWEISKVGPLFEILVPLFRSDGRFSGVAAYLLDGQSLVGELEVLGWQTARLAGAVLIIGAAVFTLLWWWAWRRLERGREELSQRNLALGRLNRELALMAKTTAVGALTSHLLHGLKNPLAGLREFTRREASDSPDAEEWHMARESILRMSGMIDETISVLREDNPDDSPEVALAPLLHSLRQRYLPVASARGAVLLFSEAPSFTTTSLRGRLLVLILTNLLDNAFSALPGQGGQVSLECVLKDGALVCRVRDNGPGLPPERASRPFEAAPSLKPGGSGLGLALSRLLAIPSQAELCLESTSAQGTCFVVRLPLAPPEATP